MQATPLPDLAADRLYDRVWAAYLPTLHQRFMTHLQLDADTQQELRMHRGASLRLRLWLNRRGTVQRVAVLTPASSESFTRACRLAAERLGHLPDLPPAILQRGQREGLEFDFGTR
ncbi:MAG: hypothetical protein HY696_05570 [Deltaproteobacteria bacterium]|nr:hypothetical protein [Deltaproteobacteria bacterium]